MQNPLRSYTIIGEKPINKIVSISESRIKGYLLSGKIRISVFFLVGSGPYNLIRIKFLIYLEENKIYHLDNGALYRFAQQNTVLFAWIFLYPEKD